jgi:hypothetical protein
MNSNTIGFGELSAIASTFVLDCSRSPHADAARMLADLTASSGRRGNAGKRPGACAKDDSDPDAEWQIVQRPGAKSGA